MITAKKFLFDDIFEQDHRAKHEPIYSQIEVDHLLSQRHNLGFNEGQAQAQSDIDAMNQLHLDHIHTMTKKILEIHHQTHAALAADVSNVCRLIIQKTLPFMLQKHGFEELFTFIESVMKNHDNTSAMKIMVSTEYVQPLHDKIIPILQQHDKLTVSIEADSTLELSECRVEWPSGGIERLLSHVNTQVDDALSRMTAYADFQKQQLIALAPQLIDVIGDDSHE